MTEGIKKEFKEITYTCPYPKCGNIFQQSIAIHSGGLNQVKCPRCGNFLKTEIGKQ